MNMKNKLLHKSIITLILASLTVLSAISSAATSTDIDATTTAFDEGIPSRTRVNTSQPFGSSLFSGNFSAQQNTGLDPNYIITPGDTVSLHIWGAIQADETTSVDAQGNIFLPEIGAVKVAGSPASALPNLVRGKLRGVYKDGVDVYVNLVTATPINVFVTGYVKKPGQYSGMQTDSVLSFLHKSGGILQNQGSYRDIRIMRQGKTIGNVDLYAFLRWGQLPRLSFKSGDTILVNTQKSTINVMGDARGNYSFELKQPNGLGRELMTMARPNPSVTNVALTGSRNRVPWSVYLGLGKFSSTVLRDGDTVRFTTDATPSTMDISVEGSHLGNSFFAAKKGTRLQELLDYIAISPDEADINNIYIKRKSVALRQKKNLNDTIDRLERSVLTSPAKSDSEASIRQQEASLLSAFIKNARKVEPDGRVVVSENGVVANIRLEDGDIIVIPFRSDVITISGEVNIPQALVYAQNAAVSDYIARSGGYTERAEKQKIIIRKPNGQVLISTNTVLQPGDEILIYPKVDTKNLQFTKDIVTIIFQIAAASAAIGII
ncbi:sugar transporter [Leucothrix arctica]|uniref:Sugar transporter n=2 Tax=Leucothrix arctica TaxID=1481894 RepID=A0A317CKI0_9GAMM|nr:sugar transporter [Leucothrix arctica]